MPHRDNAANSDAVAAVAWWPCVVIMLETSNSLDIDSASVSLLLFHPEGSFRPKHISYCTASLKEIGLSIS